MLIILLSSLNIKFIISHAHARAGFFNDKKCTVSVTLIFSLKTSDANILAPLACAAKSAVDNAVFFHGARIISDADKALSRFSIDPRKYNLSSNPYLEAYFLKNLISFISFLLSSLPINKRHAFLTSLNSRNISIENF